MLAVRLPKDIEDRLDDLARRTGRTKTFYVRQAILEHLEDMEDLYVAEKRFEDLRSGTTKTVPIEKVMERYGLED